MLYSHQEFDASHNRDDTRNSAITVIATLEAKAPAPPGSFAATFASLVDQLQLLSEEELNERALAHITDVVLVDDEGVHEMFTQSLEKLLKHVNIDFTSLDEAGLRNTALTVLSKMTKTPVPQLQALSEGKIKRTIETLIDDELRSGN